MIKNVDEKLENVKPVVVTTEVVSPVRDESATEQQALEVTSESSAVPVGDPQPTDQSQEEVAVEVPSNDDSPAAVNDFPQIIQSDSDVSEPVDDDGETPVNSEKSDSGVSVQNITGSTNDEEV